MLQSRADAHENEEPACRAELRAPPDPPQPEIMGHRGHGERADERTGSTQYCTAGSRAVDDEGVSEELMPAAAPEIDDRGGHPWAVGDGWPLPCLLAQDDAANERRDVVDHVDDRVDR